MLNVTIDPRFDGFFIQINFEFNLQLYDLFNIFYIDLKFLRFLNI